MTRLTGDLQKRFGNLKPLYITYDKLAHLKRENIVFYYALIFGSIVYGDGIEEV